MFPLSNGAQTFNVFFCVQGVSPQVEKLEGVIGEVGTSKKLYGRGGSKMHPWGVTGGIR